MAITRSLGYRSGDRTVELKRLRIAFAQGQHVQLKGKSVPAQSRIQGQGCLATRLGDHLRPGDVLRIRGLVEPLPWHAIYLPDLSSIYPSIYLSSYLSIHLYSTSKFTYIYIYIYLGLCVRVCFCG